jgi:uncharacterized protein YxjI
MNADIFASNRFIIQRNMTDGEDTSEIMDADMRHLCNVKHQHSWKTPKELVIPIAGGMRITEARLEGIDGSLLGEITEIPVGLMRVTSKWLVYDEKGVFKGAVKEKPKFVGSDWLLESREGNVVATIEGNRKKHNFEVLTADRYKQVIARCFSISESSYEVEILLSDLSPFLVLCYVIVLNLAEKGHVFTSFG